MIERIYLTVQGRRLWALGQTGANAHFTRVQIGDGTLPQGQNITQVKGLVRPIKYLPIAGVASSGPIVSVSAQITNADDVLGYYFREVGLWANDPDYGEILYAYGNAGDKADWIPPPGEARVDYVFSLELTMDNAENVTIEYQPSLVFATKDELTGLGDPTVIFQDQTSATIAEIASGSKLGVLIGKIKKLLSDLVSFRDRPTGFATKEQGEKADAALPATGNAVSASKLSPGRTIGLTGKATAAGVTFDGTSNIMLSVTDVDATKFGGQLPAYYGTAADVDTKASTVTYTATIPSTGWTGSAAPYSLATVVVDGLLATDTPIVDIVQTGTEATDSVMRDNWGKITRIVTKADGISVYATEIPSAAIPIQLKVVR